jgi:hypothetical protein
MGSVHLYSDETGQHTRGRFFIVAGVALSAYRQKIRTDLLRIEAESGKALMDWHKTSPPRRRAYVAAALALPELHGRIFFRVHERINPSDYWPRTIDTLLAAAATFRHGTRTVTVVHEGFTRGTRKKLASELKVHGRFDVWPGFFEMRPEVRLADALAGLVAQAKFPNGAKAGSTDLLPDWAREL